PQPSSRARLRHRSANGTPSVELRRNPKSNHLGASWRPFASLALSLLPTAAAALLARRPRAALRRCRHGTHRRRRDEAEAARLARGRRLVVAQEQEADRLLTKRERRCALRLLKELLGHGKRDEDQGGADLGRAGDQVSQKRGILERLGMT